MEIHVRASTEPDTDYIADALLRLAEHDGHADECGITAADIQNYGFGDLRRFAVQIAEIAEKRCGLALYYFTFSTWDARPRLFMSDLYVDASVRGMGVGRRLMQELAQIALKENCIRMEWDVLPGVDANSFYQRLGAFPVSDFQKYCIKEDALAALAGTRDSPVSI